MGATMTARDTDMAERIVSGTVDMKQPGANMYGCSPCPKCEDVFRYPRFDYEKGVGAVHCDDCGFVEPWTDPPARRSEDEPR